MLNGRVNILSKSQNSFNYIKSDDNTIDSTDLISRNYELTPVSSLFFSKLNIEALQMGLCNMVYNDSKGKYNIGKQSESELKIIMRSIYLSSLNRGFYSVMEYMNGNKNNSINECDNTIREVKMLNKKVLDWSVPQIITNIEQFDKYKKDVSKLPIPMERPSLLSSTGTKTLELQPFI